MIGPLQARWKELAPRERLLLAVGGSVAAASLLFVSVIDPLLDSMARLDRQAQKKQRESLELSELAQTYQAKRAALVAAESRLPTAEQTFSLLAFMEDAATSAHVRERIAGMQPQMQTLPQGYQETAVELRLENVLFPELLALLAELDRAPYELQVKRLQVRPKFDNPMNLDVTMRVLSYSKG